MKWTQISYFWNIFPILTKPAVRRLFDQAGKLVITTSHRIFMARKEPTWISTQPLLKCQCQYSVNLPFNSVSIFFCFCLFFFYSSALAKTRIMLWWNLVVQGYCYYFVIHLNKKLVLPPIWTLHRLVEIVQHACAVQFTHEVPKSRCVMAWVLMKWFTKTKYLPYHLLGCSTQCLY